MEVIDIGLNDLEPVSINLDSMQSSHNYGTGIELLMNDKMKSGASNVQVDLDDLDKLENELNAISGNGRDGGNGGGGLGGIFDSTTKTLNGWFGGGNGNAKKETGYEASDNHGSKLGHATADSVGHSKTWDGFTKVSDIPSGNFNEAPSAAKMSEREKRRKKRLMIKKLEEWRDKGLINSNSHFNLESNYEEVEDEYETALDDKRKKDSIKLQGWWFMTFVNSVEYMNAAFNPFDLNLDGWGEQIAEDIDSYEEIFCELHEKYKGGKLSPELSLLLRIGFSAAVVNFSNKALSSATPGFNDVIKQSPELMKMFTDATVKSMSQASPGFAFASNLMNNPDQVNTSFGPPPKAIETKTMAPPNRNSAPMQYTSEANRPDIAMGRGTMFREGGVDVNTGYSDANAQPRSIRPPPRETVAPSNPTSNQRPEMRGPNADLDGFLSGLKMKTVNIHEQPHMNHDVMVEDVEDSMISISSLKDMQNANMPKRTQSRRKNGSAKNVISLDI